MNNRNPRLRTDDVLGSPLWRPLHDILIDWNEGRMELERQNLPDLAGKIARGENNIKAVKQMVKVISESVKARDKEIAKKLEDMLENNYIVITQTNEVTISPSALGDFIKALEGD